MPKRPLSDFEKNVERVESIFSSIQKEYAKLHDSPLMTYDDKSYIKVWLNNQGFKNFIGSLCFPIPNEMEQKIKPQELQKLSPQSTPIKIQYDDNGVSQDRRSGKSRRNKQDRFSSDLNSSDQIKSEYHDSQYSKDDGQQALKRQYKRGPYKNYSVEEKQEAVRMLMQDHYSVIEISRRLRIPCKNIKRWSQQGIYRKKGGGRKRFSPETETSVANCLRRSFYFGQEIKYETVQEIARELSQDDTFKASRGWVVKFVQRQNLKNQYRFV